VAQEVSIRRTATALRPLAELQELGKIFYESGMFPDIRSAAQAIVKIQAGSELGFSPIYSMAKIYIVKGRVMVSAEALGAMVKRSGRYDYRVVNLTDTECELMFTDNDEDAYLSRFTMEDAKRADLVQPGSGWHKWPRAMLMSKALSQGARIICPHMISGAYVPEDFGFEVGENDEIEEPESVTVEPRVIVRPPFAGRVECATENVTSGTVQAGAETEVDNRYSNQATQPQIRKIMAAARSKGILIADVGTYMKAKWQLTGTKNLTKKQASELIDLIEGGKFKDELERTREAPLELSTEEEVPEKAGAEPK
jgi:hypothetical protein